MASRKQQVLALVCEPDSFIGPSKKGVRVAAVISLEIAPDEEFGIAISTALQSQKLESRLDFANSPQTGTTRLVTSPRADRTRVGDEIDVVMPEFLIRSDGTVDFSRIVFAKPVTFRGLRNAFEAGLDQPSPEVVAIVPPAGWGGDPFAIDILAWLLDHGVEIGIGFGAKILSEKVGMPLRSRRARKVAKSWKDHNLYAPYQLRLLIDRREKWNVGDLSRLLDVDNEVARQLLTSLGYVRDAGHNWVLGTSDVAISRRDRWKRDEYADPMGAYFEVNPNGNFDLDEDQNSTE